MIHHPVLLELTSVFLACQRLMSTYRDLSELSGYTARVSELLDTMEDVKAGRYQKKLVGGGSTAGRTVGKDDEVAENAKSKSGCCSDIRSPLT